MDRPIIFSAPMVRALHEGRKTQTRRIFIPPAPFDANDDITVELATGSIAPRWRQGDRLWVRENCQAFEKSSGQDGVLFPADQGWAGIENTRDAADAWVKLNHYGQRIGAVVPSIHMPRWASRLTLLVSEVRVQRLLDISEQDADAEGVCHFVEESHGAESFKGLHGADRTALVCSVYGSSRNAFRHLWEHLNGADAWDANPWVAAISFAVHRANIDALHV